MIQSMTGYGRASLASDRYRVSAEIKTLNSRYTEVVARLPPHYFEEELELRHLLTQKLVRGKIVLQLSVEAVQGGKAHPVGIDLGQYEALYRDFDALRVRLQLPEPLRLEGLLAMPALPAAVAKDVAPDEWELALQTVQAAVDALIASRMKEGQHLAQEFAEQIERMQVLLDEIEPFEMDRNEQFKLRLRQALSELADVVNASEDRFNQELVYHTEKLDIREEKVRLGVHLQAFRDTLRTKDSMHGKRLNFLAQEMHREINTLGVKAYESNIQERVIRMKELVEQLKEQLMNIV